MDANIRVSVCIAAYNGSRFIEKQLLSIVEQLSTNDEIIISDDGSVDNTLEIVRSFNDSRIKIFHNKKVRNPWRILGGDNKGFIVTKNFENALNYAKGQYIFLSDQDDIWTPNRLEKMLISLKKTDCVMCNFSTIDENDHICKHQCRPLDIKYTTMGCIKNPPFIGCMMAFNRNLYNLVFPFPKYIPSHDFWIGLCAHLTNSLTIENDVLHLYRKYGNNVSSNIHNSLLFKLLYRLYTFYQAIMRIRLQKDLKK